MLPFAVAFASTFTVTYVAGADCPTQATFEAAVIARAPHASRAMGDGDVRLEAVLDIPRRLRIQLRNGSSEERDIVADGCVEAMQSMALIAAMVLEAEAKNATPPPEPAPKPTEPATPDAPSLAPAPAPAPRPRISRTWLALGLDGVVESAAAPSPAFGGAAFVELGLVRRGWLAPSARLTGLYAQPSKVTHTDAGDARFRLALGRLHLCAPRAGSTSAEIRLCALVEAGALRGDGESTRNARGRTMPWLGAGLSVLGQVSLGGAWAAEAGASARGLFAHDEFVFAPGVTAHQVPVFAWDFQAGLSYRAF